MNKIFKYDKSDKFPRMGIWEIAQRPELLLSMMIKVVHPPTITVVVHEESRFILATQVLSADTKNSGALTLMEAVQQYQILPETLHVRDNKLFEEIKPLAEKFSFNIKYVQKLKAMPQVFREMTHVAKRLL